VVLLCAHFARNLAYYRAGHSRLTRTSPPFWITIDANFIDMAVIEWCKLFSDRRGKHFWANVVTDPSGFERAMLAHLGVTTDELASYVYEMRAPIGINSLPTSMTYTSWTSRSWTVRRLPSSSTIVT